MPRAQTVHNIVMLHVESCRDWPEFITVQPSIRIVVISAIQDVKSSTSDAHEEKGEICAGQLLRL